ncbi:hypothetical protein VNI00_014947 [Paramarasmius palmivorus]|uniref:Homeobox domain-containing protein n=1 Tax=Paramarasmius palmivorus TaxID=297713 RepID=A0AAW0BLX6_9AGAR
MSTPAPSEPDAVSVKKPRSNRNAVRATDQQRALLQQAFRQCNDPPVGEAMKLLAAETGLTEKWIKDWFRRENKKNRVAVKQEVEDSSPERLAFSEPEVTFTSQAPSNPRPKKKARLLPAPLSSNTIVIKREYSDPSLQVNSPLPEQQPKAQTPSDTLVLPLSGDIVSTVSSYQKHASKRRGRRKKLNAVSAHASNSQVNASPIPAEENSEVAHDQALSTQVSVFSLLSEKLLRKTTLGVNVFTVRTTFSR